MPADYRFAFLVEWLDPQAQLVRQYLLFFYSIDGTVEMDDIKNRRKFLRRCEYPGISFADLYLGATVNVYSRELVVVDYGDEFTKGQLEQKKEKTLALIKPDAFLKAGKIVNAIYKDGFRIGRMRSLELSRADAQEFYQEHQGKPFFDGLTQFMSSGPIVALELVADGAIQKWRKLIGPTNTFKAREEAPGCLRAQFGTDGTRNACHGSDSTASAERELNFFFNQPGRFPATARFNNCSLCLVKPHAVKAGMAGAIIGPHTTTYTPSYHCMVFSTMCPHATVYVSAYYYVCVLILPVLILPDAIVEEGFEVSAVKMLRLHFVIILAHTTMSSHTTMSVSSYCQTRLWKRASKCRQ
jgi:nucleoside-diphosphate kinase